MSSKRRIRRKQCEHKIRHKTAQDAGLAYKSLKVKIKDNAKINIYKCSFCGFYHIGHPSKSGTKKRKKPPLKAKPKTFTGDRKPTICKQLISEAIGASDWLQKYNEAENAS